ncbi:sensor histidine kinase [Thalassolituus sp.]|mgnify:CR=1 FL=1|uniref:sensor histidine kinase n=1 Tax=Thalassolituus sp. TaxID=2030822 RepID=UPI002A7F24FB|nr:ATP-binding protein [Thalassolituus sp.]|tara:strand:+ start:1620 stop:3593 length:1974 start_codon:yes stop_codon:yes gene_type:complete
MLKRLRRRLRSLQGYQFRSMQARMLAWMMLLVLLPVLLLVGIGMTYAESRLAQNMMDDLEELTQRLQREVDLAVVAQVEDVRIFSRSPYVQGAMVDFSAVYDVKELYSMDYQDQQDRYWSYLAFYAEKHGLTDLLFVNLKGDVVFSALQSDLYGANLTHVDYSGTAMQRAFQQALWQMDSVIEVGIGDSDGFAFMASPILNQQLIGVVILIPDPSTIRQFLSTTNDRSKQVLSVYHRDSDGGFNELFGDGHFDRGTLLSRILSSAYLGRDFSGSVNEWGENWLISARALPALNAVVLVRREKNMALAAITDLQFSALGVTLIILLLVFLVSRHVSGNLVSPLKDLSDNLEKIARGDRDVRSQVERQDELGELAHQFNDMAQSLRSTQAQLLQSERMASIGHLAAGVAHEINNPMSVVTSNMDTMHQYSKIYVQLVDMYDRYVKAATENDRAGYEGINRELEEFQKQEDINFVNQDMKELLNESLEGLARVKSIVGSLGVFSELDKSEEQVIDLNECLQFAVNQVNSPLVERVKVHYSIDVKQPIRFKHEQMRKAFTAIADNALKACVNKGDLRVRAYQRGQKTIIEFQDSGSGMEQEHLAHIFDPFYTTRPVGEGVGLGLSIAHSIIEAHGGSIKIMSKLGKGTKVQIALPSYSDAA